VRAVAVVALTSNQGTTSPLQAALAGIGIGGLFLVIGVLILTDYRGLARRFISLPGAGPAGGPGDVLRRQVGPGRAMPADERTFLDPGRRFHPNLVIGVVVTAMGSVAFLAGLASLALL
jgi:hypothetical protein